MLASLAIILSQIEVHPPEWKAKVEQGKWSPWVCEAANSSSNEHGCREQG